jgi:hypothetical protein
MLPIKIKKLPTVGRLKKGGIQRIHRKSSNAAEWKKYKNIKDMIDLYLGTGPMILGIGRIVLRQLSQTAA